MSDPFAYVRDLLPDDEAQRLYTHYREVFRGIGDLWCLHDLCGHNPQRLLTDQRSELQKFVDGTTFGEPYDPSKPIPHLYPGSKLSFVGEDDDYSLMIPRARTFHHGGTITGRNLQHEPIPAFLPRGEEIRPLREHPPTDWGRIEARMFRSMEVPPQVVEIKIVADTTQFRAAMERIRRKLDNQLGLYMYGAGVFDVLGGAYGTNMDRIDKLRFSGGPRQRKRGWRLAEKRRLVKIARFQ